MAFSSTPSCVHFFFFFFLYNVTSREKKKKNSIAWFLSFLGAGGRGGQKVKVAFVENIFTYVT